MPERRSHRGRLAVGRGPSLLAPPDRRGLHHAGRGRRHDHPAAAGDLRPAAAPATLLRRRQAGNGPSAPLRRALRPRSRRGQPRTRVPAGRRRLPPARPAHGRGRRRAAAGLGRPRGGGPPTTCRSPRRRPYPCGSGARALPPGGGPRRWATAGCRSSSPRTSTAPRWRPCGARRPRPAEIPRPCRPGSSSSPASEMTTRRPSGAPGGSPSSIACHPRRSSATSWRVRRRTAPSALSRYAEAGARHILVMVAGSPAVEHFGLLRAAFVGEHRPELAGMPA